MATWRGFSWKKVPGRVIVPPQLSNYSRLFAGYILAQVLGGLVGAALVYGNYANAIDIFEGADGARTQATAGLFATYPVCLCTFRTTW